MSYKDEREIDWSKVYRQASGQQSFHLQALLLPFLRIFFKLSFRIEGRLPREPCLLAPSHASRIDPFLMAVLPKGPPLRFVAKSQLFRWPLTGAWLSLGAFPVQRGTYDLHSLQLACQILERGHRLVVFPQGGIYQSIDVGQARWGAGRIARDVPVVPVFIDRRKRRIVFGEVQQFAGDDLEIARQIISSIKDLQR